MWLLLHPSYLRGWKLARVWHGTCMLELHQEVHKVAILDLQPASVLCCIPGFSLAHTPPDCTSFALSFSMWYMLRLPTSFYNNFFWAVYIVIRSSDWTFTRTKPDVIPYTWTSICNLFLSDVGQKLVLYFLICRFSPTVIIIIIILIISFCSSRHKMPHEDCEQWLIRCNITYTQKIFYHISKHPEEDENMTYSRVFLMNFKVFENGVEFMVI